ncbi:MAG: endonuclease/exonuclease/phosphatase family protein [Haloplanus sp.]
MRQLTRRDVLVGLGAAGVGTTLGVRDARAADPITVATRNCYLGADLFRLLAAASTEERTIREAVSALIDAVDRSHPGRRLDAIAGELARTEPDLVGVQEAALIRTGAPSDGTTPTATDVRYDFRERLLSALDSRDRSYRVVAATTTVDVQFPATVDGEPRALRLTDRDLLLARDTVATADPVTDTFDASLSVTRGGRTLTVERGYGVADATVGDRRLTFCNTHLESVAAATRTAQAAELRSVLADRRERVVLVGDCNSGPGASTAAYDRLTERFTDVASDAGNTCCHAADLRNAKPSLDARVDHVLVRGDLRATEVTRVGTDPNERIAVAGDRLWPSDHAGVVATVTTSEETAAATPTLTPARTPTPSPTATATATPTTTETGGAAPGFGAVPAAASLVAAALAARRHDD